MKITLTDKELDLLLESSDINVREMINNKINKPQTTNATKARQDKARNKIVSACRELMLEDKDLTVSSVSKKAEVSYNTAKKYEVYYTDNDCSDFRFAITDKMKKEIECEYTYIGLDVTGSFDVYEDSDGLKFAVDTNIHFEVYENDCAELIVY